MSNISNARLLLALIRRGEFINKIYACQLVLLEIFNFKHLKLIRIFFKICMNFSNF